MDKPLTVLDIMQMRPCYGHDRVKELWAGRESLTPLEILNLNIPIADRLWAVMHHDVIGRRTCRILACDFASHVLPIFERDVPGDMRPRRAIETALRYLAGDATKAELAAAGYAAGDAAGAAAAHAAGDAAWDAAGDAECEWQLSRVRELLAIKED